jgi:DNA-directed RNA polymerase specialized sigma24 family protein
MATDTTAKDRAAISLETALVGILAILVDEREARIADGYEATKTEALLSKAGLSYDEIAALLNKKKDAVRMTVTRSQKPKK